MFRKWIKYFETNKYHDLLKSIELEGQDNMVPSKRSDFFYTLEEDERKFLASIEKVNQKFDKTENVE